MTWTNISNTVFDTGEPTAGIHLKQMNDNFDAMASGDAGAPKIELAALSTSVTDKLLPGAAPVAGDGFTQILAGGMSSSSGTSGNVTTYSIGGEFRALANGTLRLRYDLTFDEGTFGGGSLTVYAGTSSKTYADDFDGSDFFDFSCVRGQFLRIRATISNDVSATANYVLSNVRVTTSNDTLGAA